MVTGDENSQPQVTPRSGGLEGSGDCHRVGRRQGSGDFCDVVEHGALDENSEGCITHNWRASLECPKGASASSPRLTRQCLPWVRWPQMGTTPTVLRQISRASLWFDRPQPRCGWWVLCAFTQGSSCVATLGCVPKSPWDSPHDAPKVVGNALPAGRGRRKRTQKIVLSSRCRKLFHRNDHAALPSPSSQPSPLGRRSQVRRTDVKPCFLESRPVSELIRGDKTFNQLINASISSGSTGISAIKSTGPCSVTRMSFSNRTPKPSSGM